MERMTNHQSENAVRSTQAAEITPIVTTETVTTRRLCGLVLAVRGLLGLGGWLAARGLRLGRYEFRLYLASVADG